MSKRTEQVSEERALGKPANHKPERQSRPQRGRAEFLQSLVDYQDRRRHLRASHTETPNHMLYLKLRARRKIVPIPDAAERLIDDGEIVFLDPTDAEVARFPVTSVLAYGDDKQKVAALETAV